MEPDELIIIDCACGYSITLNKRDVADTDPEHLTCPQCKRKVVLNE